MLTSNAKFANKKFTFRKDAALRGLAGVAQLAPNTQIKIGGEICGTIFAPTIRSNSKQWSVSFSIYSNEQQDAWKNITMTKKFDTESEAREWVSKMQPQILEKWILKSFAD